MGNKAEEKTGRIAEVIFHNEENGYTIAVMETETERFTIVGYLPSCAAGISYRLYGSFKIHPVYGEQFVFTEFEQILPTGEKDIENFLASGAIRGVGKKTAAEIVKRFGEDALRVIGEEPAKLMEVDGIGEKRMKAIADSYALHREFAKVSMFFQKFGVSPKVALKMYKQYGKAAVELVKENPYRLVEDIYGIGFKKADAIAEKMGIEPDSPFRIKSAIRYGLNWYTAEGNAYMPEREFLEKVSELLELPSEIIGENLTEMAFSGDIKVDTVEGVHVVYLYPYYLAEQKICRAVAAISSAELKPLTVDIDHMISATEKETGLILSDQQAYAVKSSLANGISIITGGPGTGKTTIINTIINIFQYSGLKVAISAPTGRAAKRITETSGHRASTIHRLLEYYYSENEDSMRFGKTKDDPLDYDVIIVDEASMIDLMLMAGLADAIRPGTRLILAGDSDQLPPVGAGNVLKDLIESEYVHVVVLNEIFRQARESMIVVNAHRINQGEYPVLNSRDTDFFLMKRTSEQEIVCLIVDLVTERLPAYYEDVVPSDIQVLTPVKKGPLGSVSLNSELQQALNPPREGIGEKRYGGRVFREKDKVMQIKNNYLLKWRKKSDLSEGQGVFNGDIGFVEKIDSDYGQLTVAFDDDRYVTYDFSQLDQLELAYAMTVHKSQGSEFPVVVMPVFIFPPMLATRNLLYTAVTRGKKAVVLVGSADRMNAMVDNNRIKMRYSGLKYRLKRLFEIENENRGI